MKELDIKDCKLDSLESYYHLTRRVHESNISEKGLVPDIGTRSKDGIGKESTSKVFFTKSLDGTLIFLNRTLNILYSFTKEHKLAQYSNAVGDDNIELYKQTLISILHNNKSEKNLTEAVLALGKLYFERGIFYKLNLKHCTKEEFQNMSEQEQNQIDYFSDDIDEETHNQHHSIHNMHTRIGKGIKPSQMELITADGKKSALDIIISMSEKYMELNPGKSLPVLEYGNGQKDIPLLEMLISQTKEKKKGLDDCINDDKTTLYNLQVATKETKDNVIGAKNIENMKKYNDDRNNYD